jgi:hypothetical protein
VHRKCDDNKKPRKKETIPRASVLGTEGIERTNGGAQKKDEIPTQETRTGNIPEVKKPVQTEKRKSTMQMGEQRKKMKAQKNPIQLTITEDDAELVEIKSKIEEKNPYMSQNPKEKN